MAADLHHLESRYLNACQKQEVLPNSSMLLSLSKAKHQKARFGQCILEIFIDHLSSMDIPPLIETMSGASLSQIDAISIRQKSSNVSLDGENLLLLLHAVNQKLQIVDLINSTSWKDVLRYVALNIHMKRYSMQGSQPAILSYSEAQHDGKFMELHTLNLDSSVHLTSFHIGCFSCMPKLARLSMCETRVANLWTTSVALSKLQSLTELRFQNCSCCYDTGPCPTAGGVIGAGNEKICSSKQQFSSFLGSQRLADEKILKHTIDHSIDDALTSLCSKNLSLLSNEFLERTTEELSDESDPEFSSDVQGIDSLRTISDTCTEFSGQTNPNIRVRQSKHSLPSNMLSSVSAMVPSPKETVHLTRRLNNSNSFNGNALPGEPCNQLNHSDSFSVGQGICKDESYLTNMLNIGKTRFSLENQINSHPSPICFERYYREYMITSLPNLKVLDNLPIGYVEREQAKGIFKRFFECMPYSRQYKDNLSSILQRREIGSTVSKVKQPYSRESNHSLIRSLSAAKVSSCPQPHLHSVSKIISGVNEEPRSFRPRQFEYHPADPRLMVFGTLDGELVVINHESEKLVGYLPSVRPLNSVLALCWLKKHPSKIVAGSDNGCLQLYDVCKMPSKIVDQYSPQNASVHNFDEFEQLTSVHINSSDEYFLASGFSNHVALYDVGSGKRLQIFKDLHKEHINVVKFSHHSPSVFATASFDKYVKMWDLRQGTSQPCYTASSSRGNVMVCFSPDDYYLLTSAVDNEVKQLLAVDGRLQTSFDIASTGNSQNYTRSYYMNGRDYIVTGSCEEHVVRVCSAQTGRRLQDIYLEGRGSKNSMYIQSLRGDPFRDFHMSILAAYWRPFTKTEILKVNLLQTEDWLDESTAVTSVPALSGIGV